MRRGSFPTRRAGARRGFTLAEMMLAGLITTFVLGSLTICMSQLGRAKNTTRERLNANIRAHAALTEIRRVLISATRSDDLFNCQFQLMDGEEGGLPRDEVLLFNTSLRMVRDIDYNGEGIEYESQFRIEDDSYGPVLWLRRDSVHDEFIYGGGRIMPLVEGVTALSIEVYDGINWWESWDSEVMGMPIAVRVQVTASGHAGPHDVFDAATTTLRTVVPLDRFMPPMDQVLPTEEEEQALNEWLDELLAIPSPEDEQNPEDGGEAGDIGDVIIPPDGGRPDIDGGGQGGRGDGGTGRGSGRGSGSNNGGVGGANGGASRGTGNSGGGSANDR